MWDGLVGDPEGRALEGFSVKDFSLKYSVLLA